MLWALDFQFDTLADGRTIQMLNIIDEFTREALANEVDRTIDADPVVAVLDRLAVERGAHRCMRARTTGPELPSHAVAHWCRFTEHRERVHRPRLAMAERLIESFNGNFRDELLNGWQVDSLLEARVIVEHLRSDYNRNRPHTKREIH